MNTLTLKLLSRVQTLVSDHGEWFEAVKQWYENVGLTQRVVRQALKDERVRGEITVRANGHTLAAASDVTDPAAARVTWLLHSNLLQRGENKVTVQLAPKAACPLFLTAVSFEQDYLVPWQTLSLAAAQPAATPNLALVGRKLAFHADQSWTVPEGGLIVFKLLLPQAAPVNFTLWLAEGRANVWVRLGKLLAEELVERVRAAIKDKIKEKLWEAARGAVKLLAV